MNKETFFMLMSLFQAFIILGASANFIAITHNNCKMPVAYDGYFESDKHKSYSNISKANYWFLGDIFDGWVFLYSIGDVFLFLGVFGLLYITIVEIKRKIKFKP